MFNFSSARSYGLLQDSVDRSRESELSRVLWSYRPASFDSILETFANTFSSKFFEMTTRRRPHSTVPADSTAEDHGFTDSHIDPSPAANQVTGNISTGRCRPRSLLALGIRRLWSSVKSAVFRVGCRVGSGVSRTSRTTCNGCATLAGAGLKMVRSVDNLIQTGKARLRSVVPFSDEVIDLMLAIFLPVGPATALSIYRLLYAILMPLDEDAVRGMSWRERRNYRVRQIVFILGELILTTCFPPWVSIMFAVSALLNRFN